MTLTNRTYVVGHSLLRKASDGADIDPPRPIGE